MEKKEWLKKQTWKTVKIIAYKQKETRVAADSRKLKWRRTVEIKKPGKHDHFLNNYGGDPVRLQETNWESAKKHCHSQTPAPPRWL